MQYRFISRQGHSRLLIIFAGWGMDSEPFSSLEHPAYDIAVVWDYRSMALALPLGAYSEVCVMAWSMGVWAAQQVMPQLGANISRRIAVCGTPLPVSDTEGIPSAVFDATLSAMSPQALEKFNRRMCGGTEAMLKFKEKAPQRGIDELIEELSLIGIRAKAGITTSASGMWDIAVIGKRDAIFPLENQRRAWAAVQRIEEDCPHMPDFQSLINRLLINKPMVSRKFTGAASTYDSAASVQAMVAHDLAMAIRQHAGIEAITRARRIVEVGSGTGLFTLRYAHFVEPDADWQLWDIADVPDGAVPEGATFVKADAELAIRSLPGGSADAILSSSALQWLGSPMRFIGECQRVLRPGGLLAFSTFDSDNLTELRALAPGSALVSPALDEWQAWLEQGFNLLHASRNRYQIHYDSPRKVIEHLRLTGVNGTAGSVGATRRLLAAYPRTRTGRCPLTYTPIIFVAVKP